MNQSNTLDLTVFFFEVTNNNEHEYIHISTRINRKRRTNVFGTWESSFVGGKG